MRLRDKIRLREYNRKKKEEKKKEEEKEHSDWGCWCGDEWSCPAR